MLIKLTLSRISLTNKPLLLICFQVHNSIFSAKSDKLFLSYIAISLRVHFLSGHSVASDASM